MPASILKLLQSQNSAPVVTSGVDILADDATPGFALGTRYCPGDGREFVYVEAIAALAAGNPVQIEDLITGPYLADADVDAAAAAGTDTLTATGDFAALTADQLVNAVVYINGAGLADGMGQVRIIKNRLDDNTIQVTEPWTTALTTNSDYVIFRPFGVSPKAATALTSPGIAQGVITINQFGWVQTKGLGHVLVDGSQDPILLGEVVTCGTAVAGTAQGRVAGGLTVGDLQGKLGVGVADTAAVDALAPLYIDPAGSF